MRSNAASCGFEMNAVSISTAGIVGVADDVEVFVTRTDVVGPGDRNDRVFERLREQLIFAVCTSRTSCR